jgi:signal transduction histidine kinase/ActR/RegA family two-component response regulator
VSPAEPEAGERILVLAPLGRDAEMTVSLLEGVGRRAQACRDAGSVAACMDEGAGLVLTTEEALAGDEAFARIATELSRQPPWSDIPLLVFTSSHVSEAADAGALDRLRALGNVTLLERPIRVATLLSAVNAALRARRRQYELRAVLQQLRGRIRERDQFLAMLGHELRNPLAAITTALEATELLQQPTAARPPDRLAQLRGIVRRQALTLSRLVDDLLEVSRVTSGKISLQRTRFDLALLVRRAIDAIEPAARDGHLAIRLAEPVPSLWVNGDPTRLEQVLSNLLGNAVKYTLPGGRIDVTLWREADQAALAIGDNGVGIDGGTLPNIFDLFHQADRTLNRAKGGLGIGLTLVRSLVELHGGTVAARSDGLGRGSEFIVRLPLVSIPESVSASACLAPRSRRMRVFVLEDYADNREALVLLLQQLGHEVESSENGMIGVRRIIETAPDLALVDIGLPGLDGYEVARQVRSALGARVALVAITGYGQKEDQRRALDAGFDRHIAKPVDLSRLQELLDLDGELRERSAPA